MAIVYGKKAVNKIVAPQPEVQHAVEAEGRKIHVRAVANLAAVHDSSNATDHRIESEKNLDAKYGFLDYEISLVGPAPLSVEFGHFIHNAAFPRYVVGKYILMRAAGLM